MALFQRRRRRKADPDAPLGLVVPIRGVVVTDPKTNEVIYDEIREREYEYRMMKGRTPITFIEEVPE